MGGKTFGQMLRRSIRKEMAGLRKDGGAVVIINVNSSMVVNHTIPEKDDALGHFLTGVEGSSLRIAVCAIGIATLLGFVGYKLGVTGAIFPLKVAIAPTSSIGTHPSSSQPAAGQGRDVLEQGVPATHREPPTCEPKPQRDSPEISLGQCADPVAPRTLKSHGSAPIVHLRASEP